MPAIRSRTEHWLESLQNVMSRGGSLELTVARPARAAASGAGASETEPDPPGSPDCARSPVDGGAGDLVWRVRLLSVREDAIVVEQPAAFGSSFRFRPGLDLIGAVTIGQNRWMFHTRTLACSPMNDDGRTLVLSAPERMERCTRRAFFRISTASLNLPRAQCWPLLNPATVGAAEAANRALIRDLIKAGGAPLAGPMESLDSSSLLLPEVGAPFVGRVLNVSGGGLGMMIEKEQASAASAKPLWWVRLDFRPDIPAPVSMMCRLSHRHVDSTQSLYCGLAFELAHSPEQKQFIIELFARYTDELQKRQAMAQARVA